MKLTPHFALEEFVVSREALVRKIDNTPPPEVLANLRELAQQLEGVRTKLGCPVVILSGYRCPELNKVVRGSKTSQHMTGEAADIIVPGYGSCAAVAARLVDSPEVQFDQLIYEGTWVHFSYRSNPRRQILTAKFSSSGTTYVPGLHIRL